MVGSNPGKHLVTGERAIITPAHKHKNNTGKRHACGAGRTATERRTKLHKVGNIARMRNTVLTMNPLLYLCRHFLDPTALQI